MDPPFLTAYHFNDLTEIIKSIFTKNQNANISRFLEHAISFNNFPLIKRLLSISDFKDSRVTQRAIKEKKFRIAKYLINSGFPLTKELCSEAVTQGNLDFLIYLRSRDCPWDITEMCSFAAVEGHLEVLKYAHENGCPWDERTCSEASRGGHLEVLKYAHENGCPWNEWTCSGSAQEGHLEVLKYAHENGCPWNKELCLLSATHSKFVEIVKYLTEN